MLCFSVFCTNFIWSQTISINSPTSVEVGINNSFSFKFTPPSSSLYGNYNISHWEITSSNSNMNNSGNSYYNVYLSSGVPINTAQFSTISIPIKWEDNSNSTTDKLRIKVTYSLQQTAPGVGFGNWSQAVTAEYNITKSDGTYYPYYDITIFRVLPPTISSPTILNCSTNNVQICASNYGSANSFAWSITGGSIASGQGSSCITVTPSANDNVTTTCLAKRLSGLPTYTATTTATITRTPRSIAYVIDDTKNWLGIGAGRSLSLVSQSGISSINWIAPGCTITGQGTLNATITPTTLITSGTLINVYASVTFTGGCIFNSPINAYTVFSNAAPYSQRIHHINSRWRRCMYCVKFFSGLYWYKYRLLANVDYSKSYFCDRCKTNSKKCTGMLYQSFYRSQDLPKLWCLNSCSMYKRKSSFKSSNHFKNNNSPKPNNWKYQCHASRNTFWKLSSF